MSDVMIFNYCHRIFNDDSIAQVEFGSLGSQRKQYIDFSFRNEWEAGTLISDLDQKWGTYLDADGSQGQWSISSPVYLTIGELQRAISKINLIIELNNPIEFSDWLSHGFQV